MVRQTHRSPWAIGLMLFGLLIVTMMVFAPAIDHKFVAWDDQAQLYANPDFNPVTWQNLQWNITHTRLTVWMPLTYFVWGGIAAVAHRPPDKQNIALDPAMFHIACIVFHLIATAFCFLILRRLLKRDIPAVLGAALFALHPLQVEPVAWASGMYTVLSGAFSLAAIEMYLRSVDAERAGRRWIWFAVSTLLFVAAMLTKPSAMVLPGILVIIHLMRCRLTPSPGTPGEGWGEGRTLPFSSSDPLRKSASSPHPNPFPVYRARGPELIILIALLLIWIPLGVADFRIAKHFQTAANVPQLPMGQRILVAGDAISFYLSKLFVPMHLIPDYGRWPARILALPATRWMLLPPILLIAIGLIFLRRAPRISVAIAIFLLGIAPFLGFVRFDFQFFSTVADRYAYLAMLGPALLLGVILTKWPRWPIYSAAGLCLVALAIQSVLQVQRWQDTRTLFTYAVSVRPDSIAANNILATEDFSSDPASADVYFQKSLAVRPDDPTTHYNYGLLLAHRDLPAAIAQWQATVALNPQHYKALDELGVAMMHQHKFGEAQTYFERSIQAADQTHADFPQGHQHLATVEQYFRLGS